MPSPISAPTARLRRALVEAYWCYSDSQAELYSVREGRIYHREIALTEAEIAGEPRVFREICKEVLQTISTNK